MKNVRYFIISTIAVFALSTGVFAQQGEGVTPTAGSKGDSAAAVRQTPNPAQQSQSKQASVSRTTKKTNWSKIKTLFE
jgi:hypothetical protein